MCAEGAIGPAGSHRWNAAVAAALATLAAATFAIVRIVIDRTPTPEAGAANLASLRPFWMASALSWSALTVLALMLIQRERSGAMPRGGGLIVIGIAIIARLVVLAAHQPSLSDDIYRYVFDGRNARSGVNPYLVLPADRQSAADPRYPGEGALAQRVNNEELHTIYLPVSQWAFGAAMMALPGDAADPEDGALVLRAMMVAFEIVMLALLLAALRGAGRSPWWLALYAWHPLPLSEIAGSGHQDAIGLALLVAALLIHGRWSHDRRDHDRRHLDQRHHDQRPWAIAAWTVPVALAALVKPVALPAAAFMLRRRAWPAWLLCGAIGVGVTAAIAGPMLFAHDGAPVTNLRETATRFTLKWAHFGAVYEPMLTAIETLTPEWTNDPQEQLSRKICTGLLIVIAIALWIRSRSPWASCAHLFVAMVLLAPAAHPWYLLWALALVPMAPSATAWVLSLTLPWGYAVLGDTVEWTVAPWLMVCAYVPVGAALVWDVRAGWRRPRPEGPAPEARGGMR